MPIPAESLSSEINDFPIESLTFCLSKGVVFFCLLGRGGLSVPIPAESLSSEMLDFPIESLTFCLSKGVAF